MKRTCSVIFVCAVSAVLFTRDAQIRGRAPASVAAPVSVMPQKRSDVLHNPGMGFVFYCGHVCGSNIPAEADVLYTSNLTWGAVEPSPGTFDFSGIQGILNTAKSSGRRIAIRLMTSFQNVDHPTPQWLTDPSQGGTVPLLSDAQPGNIALAPNFIYEPEWWHPDYAPAFQRMVAALGKAFNGEPSLDYVDIRVYGWWNEGHRYHATVPWPANVDKREFVVEQSNAYFKAFPNTPLVVETASDVPMPPPALQYPLDTGIDVALSLGAWMRRDGFGAFVSPRESQLLQANWKKSLIIAEPGGMYADFLAGKVRTYEKPGHPVATIDDCIEDMLDHHINYFPMNGWADFAALRAARPDLVKTILAQTGYRFEVSQASWSPQVAAGGILDLNSTWHNAGVGRLPFPRALTVFLLDAQGNVIGRSEDAHVDLTTLVNGADQESHVSVSIPRGTPLGDYSVAVAVVDPSTNLPSISLGIQGDDGHLRFVLGSVSVN